MRWYGYLRMGRHQRQTLMLHLVQNGASVSESHKEG